MYHSWPFCLSHLVDVVRVRKLFERADAHHTRAAQHELTGLGREQVAPMRALAHLVWWASFTRQTVVPSERMVVRMCCADVELRWSCALSMKAPPASQPPSFPVGCGASTSAHVAAGAATCAEVTDPPPALTEPQRSAPCRGRPPGIKDTTHNPPHERAPRSARAGPRCARDPARSRPRPRTAARGPRGACRALAAHASGSRSTR